MNYTYIVRCRDNTFYTGWTTNIEKRIEVHNSGKGAKYTKSRRPVELVYFEEFNTKEEAMRREYEIKQMTRKKKEKLIGGCREIDSSKQGDEWLTRAIHRPDFFL